MEANTSGHINIHSPEMCMGIHMCRDKFVPMADGTYPDESRYVIPSQELVLFLLHDNVVIQVSDWD